MSGGSYDYLYYKIEDAGRILSNKSQPLYRQAFGHLLIKVAAAMHDVEWVDSGDYCTGDDEKAIMECILPELLMKVSVEQAETIMEQLKQQIKQAKKVK